MASSKLAPIFTHYHQLHSVSTSGYFKEVEVADLFLHYPSTLILYNTFVPEYISGIDFWQRVNFYYWIYKNSSLLPQRYLEDDLLATASQLRNPEDQTISQNQSQRPTQGQGQMSHQGLESFQSNLTFQETQPSAPLITPTMPQVVAQSIYKHSPNSPEPVHPNAQEMNPLGINTNLL